MEAEERCQIDLTDQQFYDHLWKNAWL